MVDLQEILKQLNQASGSLCLAAAAARLDVSPSWMREHLEEFPNVWRLSAGSAQGRNVGELRFPVRDLVAYEERRRVFRLSPVAA